MKLKINFSKKFYIRTFWGLFAFPFLILLIIFILISQGVFGPMPTFEDLENPENNLASQVISEDGELLGKYYYQNRSYVEFKELSPNIVNALLATEDIRFRKHSGIDAKGLARVAFKTLLLGKSSGGGSTITQQLAKNLFPRDTTIYNSSLARIGNLVISKFKEWVTATKLERNYTKKEILVMYLNTVPFGGHSYGIKSAAKTFFDTHPDSLKVEEASVLVGLLKAPSKYSPVRNPEQSKERRNVVLKQMEKNDFITTHEYDSLRSMPLDLKYNQADHNTGLATYFREQVRSLLNKNKPKREFYTNYRAYKKDSTEWANNPVYGWCNKHTKPNGENYDIYKDGLRIHTTINAKMQKYAEKAVKKHLSENIQPKFFEKKEDQLNAPFSKDLDQNQVDQIISRSIRNTDRYYHLKKKGLSKESIRKKFEKPVKMKVFTYEGEKDTVMSPLDSILYHKHILRAGLMSMNPKTGHVKAYVGGPNFKHFKYDHVMQGKRQIGSTVKPFLYTLAMQEGYSPCYKVANVPYTFYMNDSTWTPKNSGPSDRDGDMVRLKWGLAHSVNYISAWLVKQFNAQSVVDVMKKMGIESRIAPVPSIFLGTADISLHDMVGAYSTFANKGVYTKPQLITRIEDRRGNVISTFTPPEREVINEQTSYLMLELLQSVVKEGTAIRLRSTYNFENEIAGKTGTTQNQSDGWFMGVTPNLVSGVWVGGENRSIHFNNIRLGQGANMALPIWALYMKQIYNDPSLKNKVSKDDKFEKPLEFNYTLDCEEYDKKHGSDRSDDFF